MIIRRLEHVPGEENPDSRSPVRRFQDLENLVGDLLTILDLVHDTDLHVIHDQREARRITNIFQGLRNIHSECPMHDNSP